MIACIILNNVTVETRRNTAQAPPTTAATSSPLPSPEPVRATLTPAPSLSVMPVSLEPSFERFLGTFEFIRNEALHKQLQANLVEHIWQEHGNTSGGNI
ncbi:hypothetical protein BC941DRAFT_441503 [Chlamydoabsidia padenii]|nr:hypothetical protein BC941DRAFT_441503 [Chlamydoabsidia padenii]